MKFDTSVPFVYDHGLCQTWAVANCAKCGSPHCRIDAPNTAVKAKAWTFRAVLIRPNTT